MCQPVSSSLEHLRFPFGGGGNRGPEVRSPARGCLGWTCGSAPAPHSSARPASATSPDGGDGLTVLVDPVCRPRGRAQPAPRPKRSAPPVCSTDHDLGALAAPARGSGLLGYKPPSRATGPQGLSVAVALVLRVTYSFDARWSPKGLGSGLPRGVRRGL